MADVAFLVFSVVFFAALAASMRWLSRPDRSGDR